MDGYRASVMERAFPEPSLVTAAGLQHVTTPSNGARADEAPPRPSPQTSPVVSTLPPGPAVSPPLPAILLAPVCYHRPPWSPQVFPPGRPRPPDPQRRLRHSVQRYGSLPPRPRQAQSPSQSQCPVPVPAPVPAPDAPGHRAHAMACRAPFRSLALSSLCVRSHPSPG
jgi:hypothetical protein